MTMNLYQPSNDRTLSSTLQYPTPQKTLSMKNESINNIDTKEKKSKKKDKKDKKRNHDDDDDVDENDHYGKSSNKSTKTVSFSIGPTIDKIYTIESASKLSSFEKKKRWVSSEEFAAAKRDCTALLKAMERRGKTCDIFAYRGMEIVDPAAIVRRQRHYKDSVSAVLEAQKLCKTKGKKCKPKELRKVYKELTMESMKEAIENAYLDGKAIADYIKEETPTSSSTELGESTRTTTSTAASSSSTSSSMRRQSMESDTNSVSSSSSRYRICDFTGMQIEEPSYKTSDSYNERLRHMRRRWSSGTGFTASTTDDTTCSGAGVLSDIVESFPFDDDDERQLIISYQ